MDNKTQERIKADAEAYVQRTRGQQGRVETYIAGATAEHEKTEAAIDAAIHKERNALQAKVTQMDIDWLKRSQVLVDALEWIKTYGPCGSLTVKFIDKQLEQWKSGQRKEVGEKKLHSGNIHQWQDDWDIDEQGELNEETD